jgi:hypothetical protein
MKLLSPLYWFLEKIWNLGMDGVLKEAQENEQKVYFGKQRPVIESVSNPRHPIVHTPFGRIHEAAWLLSDPCTKRSALHLIRWTKKNRIDP